MTSSHPVHGDRSPDDLARIFRTFGRDEAPQLEGHLYEALCPAIAEDRELLELLASVPPSQAPPNILFGALHYLLLEDDGAALRRFYRDLVGPAERTGAPSEAFPAFREYVLDHREQIEEIFRTRRVQTNVIQRCTLLLPAFAHLARQAAEPALALIEIGPSAGLNLLWDRYAYRYTRPGGSEAVRWGDETSGVTLPCELRGDLALPALPSAIPVASRVGIEYDRIDVEDDDAVRWLRALIWPEHVERHDRLEAAIALARSAPPRVIEGDATSQLAPLLAEAPSDAALCVYATFVFSQIAFDDRQRIFDALAAASTDRVVWFVSIEGTGGTYAETFLHRYERGDRTTTHLANCSPHGRWIEWLAI